MQWSSQGAFVLQTSLVCIYPQSGLATAQDYLIYDVPDIYYYGKSDIYFCRRKSDHVAFIRVFPDPQLHLTYLKLRKLKKNSIVHIISLGL